MKKLLTIILCLSGWVAIAQEPADYNFIIDEAAKTVIWQKVYDGSCSTDNVLQAMLAGKASNLNSFEGSVTCDYFFQSLEYKDLGYTFMNRSMFVRHPTDAHVVIQIKDGRYRVTVSNIVCHIDSVGDRELNSMSTIHTGDYTPKYRKITMHILDYNFDRVFGRLASPPLDDNW